MYKYFLNGRDGNPVTTTPKLAAAAPGGLGALAALASGGGGGGGGLGSLLKNPQILAALLANTIMFLLNEHFEQGENL